MALAKNGRLLFNEPPKDFPIPGRTTVYDDTETIDLDCVQLDGGILIKTLYLLADPYLRERMEEATIRSDYSAPFHLGKPITGLGIAQVIQSEKEGIKVGDNIFVLEIPL